MATAKQVLNAGCRLCTPSDTNSSCTLGSMLEALRDAIVAMATNIDADNGTIGTDYVANVITAFGLADSGNYDLDNN